MIQDSTLVLLGYTESIWLLLPPLSVIIMILVGYFGLRYIAKHCEVENPVIIKEDKD